MSIIIKEVTSKRELKKFVMFGIKMYSDHPYAAPPLLMDDMNLSGNAVRYWMTKENIPLENVLVVVDDLALPFGVLRLKQKGSDAGHNGLKNIQEMVGTNAYSRLRFGIGNDFPKGRQIDFVLGQWSDEDMVALQPRIEIACDIIKSFCLAGVQNTMNQYNNK